MKKLSLTQNETLFRTLHTYIKSGIPPVSYLTAMVQQLSNKSLKTIVQRLERAVRKGESLTAGLRLSRDAFEEAHLDMFALGEETGSLERVTQLLTEHCERKIRLKRKLITGLIYPFFLLLMAIILPPLYLLFTKGTLAYLHFISKPLFAIGMLLLVGHVLHNHGLGPIKQVLDRITLKLPVIGPIMWRLELATYFRMFALGTEAGSASRLVAEMAARSVKNTCIKNRLLDHDESRPEYFDPLARMLPVVSHFPGIHNIIVSGFETGNVPEMMNKAAEFLENEADTYLNTLVVLLPVLFFLIVAFYIGARVISFWSQLYSFQ